MVIRVPGRLGVRASLILGENVGVKFTVLRSLVDSCVVWIGDSWPSPWLASDGHRC